MPVRMAAPTNAKAMPSPPRPICPVSAAELRAPVANRPSPKPAASSEVAEPSANTVITAIEAASEPPAGREGEGGSQCRTQGPS
jgi:hypothetical protein